MNPESAPYYFGGGLALGFVSNETEYDAGAGRYWIMNCAQLYSAVNKQTKLIPHLVGGYRFNEEKSAVEVKYRFIGADLPATDSAFSTVYPTAQAAKLDGLLTVTYVHSFN